MDVLAYVKALPGVLGSTLLAHFGSPPHGRRILHELSAKHRVRIR